MAQMGKKRRLNFLRYLNPKNIATEVHRYGYDFSMKKYIRNISLVFAAIAILAYFYKLNNLCIFLILALTALFLPSLLFTTYKNMYEQKKFDDLTNYMEQMLYSFKRRNKILTSLEDTLYLFPEGEMHEAIEKAIRHIREADTRGDIYKEALSFIEEDYGCKRLRTLHDFLIKIENTGGEYDLSIDILLNDRKLWIDRTYSLQLEKKNIIVKTAIGILLSFAVGLVAVFVIPEDLEVASQWLSQIVTSIMFLCNLGIWYGVNRVLSGSLIKDTKEYSEEEINRKYDIAFKKDMRKPRRVFAIIGALMIPAAVFAYFKLGIGAAIAGAIFIYIIMTHPGRLHRNAVKKIKAEVEKEFPDWLLNMSLLLQSDNVHVALSKSIPDAAPVLREQLSILEKGIELSPNSVEPYLEFMKELQIPDVQSAMKMLCALAEYGAKDTTEQIMALVERNSVMTDRAEKLRAEDRMAGLGFFVLAPMITGVLKLVTDLALIVFSMLDLVDTL